MDNDRFQELVLKKLELLDTLTNDAAALKTKVDNIDASQFRMENELTEKVRGLYDFREVQNDINDRVLNSLDRIEAKIDVLQLETAHIRRVK
ncbi:chromosome partition protein smc [hydrocarbon metagenome]|uniref:Chromosome partition protein smc n=1 Tax=hydrocarbon metagenome TaxID=938273 RepID=A0A0W8E364_9ZZZZ